MAMESPFAHMARLDLGIEQLQGAADQFRKVWREQSNSEYETHPTVSVGPKQFLGFVVE